MKKEKWCWASAVKAKTRNTERAGPPKDIIRIIKTSKTPSQ